MKTATAAQIFCNVTITSKFFENNKIAMQNNVFLSVIGYPKANFRSLPRRQPVSPDANHCAYLILSVSCNLYCASFLITPCLVVAVQPCME